MRNICARAFLFCVTYVDGLAPWFSKTQLRTRCGRGRQRTELLRMGFSSHTNPGSRTLSHTPLTKVLYLDCPFKLPLACLFDKNGFTHHDEPSIIYVYSGMRYRWKSSLFNSLGLPRVCILSYVCTSRRPNIRIRMSICLPVNMCIRTCASPAILHSQHVQSEKLDDYRCKCRSRCR